MNIIQLKNKKIALAMTVLMACFGVFAYTAINDDKEDITVEYSMEHPYETLEDLLNEATHVVIGTIDDKETLGKWEEKYTMSIEESYLNAVDSESIDVYEASGSLETGKKYVLFLEASESEYYPRTVYTSVVKDSMLEVSDGNIVNLNKYTSENQTLKELVKIFKKQGVKAEKSKTKRKVVDKFANHEAIIDSADVIIAVSVKNINEFNKFVSNYEVEVKKEYKGSIGDIKRLTLPTGIDEDGEVVLFLKEIGKQNYMIAARKDCVISKDGSERWNEISLLLEK